jgi:arylsulfatase
MVEMGLFPVAMPWTPPPILSDEEYASKFFAEYRLDTDTRRDPDYRKVGWASGRYDNTNNSRDRAFIMQVYAAQIDCLDQGVGRVLDALERRGELDNTLIVFCSDNGCSNEAFHNQLAQASDTPFQRWKMSAYEGGVCTPFIMHWPARTPAAQRGSVNRTTGHLVDIMATVMDAGNATYPAVARDGRPVPPCEGRSLLPILRGEHVPLKAPIGIEHKGNVGLILEDWKITADGREPWRLYDLRQDRFELSDVAAKHPEKVAEMEQMWKDWANRVGATRNGK